MWGFLLLLFVIGLVGLALFPIMYLTYPNLYLGQVDMSFRTQSGVHQWLIKSNETPVKIKVGEQVKQFLYDDLGVSFNLAAMETALFPPRDWMAIPGYVQDWIGSWKTSRIIPPVVEFAPEFEGKILALSGNKQTVPDAVTYDQNGQLFAYQANNQSYHVDVEDMKLKIINSFGKEWGVIEPNFTRAMNKAEERIEANNARVQRVFGEDVEVVVKDSLGEARFNLLGEDLKSMTRLSYNKESWDLEVAVDQNKVKNYLSRAYEARGLPIPPELSLRKASQTLAGVVDRRFAGVELQSAVLGVDDGPNSEGNEDKRFIEVDLSQQKMYLWNLGKVEKAYKVSTGLYYPTPTGTFAIMNKADNAFSAIFGVYMPYWMAFNYQNDIGAYVGIHELPYKLVNGAKVYRFGNYIGTRKTGGCVALTPGEAKEVYDWAMVGTRVRIYD